MLMLAPEAGMKVPPLKSSRPPLMLRLLRKVSVPPFTVTRPVGLIVLPAGGLEGRGPGVFQEPGGKPGFPKKGGFPPGNHPPAGDINRPAPRPANEHGLELSGPAGLV